MRWAPVLGDLVVGRVIGTFCLSREEVGTGGRGWSGKELVARNGWDSCLSD